MPAIGLHRESDPTWVLLGSLGVVAFAVAQLAALYVLVTPWLAASARHRLLACFAGTAVASVPLVGPVGSDRWATWAWLGASIVGSAPLLLRRRSYAALVMVGTVVVAIGVALWTRGSVRDYALITGTVGIGV